MQTINKQFKTILMLMLVCAGIVLWVQCRPVKRPPEVDISKIPIQIGDWKAEEIPIEKETKDILETETVFMREYTNSKKESVLLAVVYYKDARVALHLPESCFSGAGSFITERAVEYIPLADGSNFSANKLAIKGDKGNIVALYYFETNNKKTASYGDMRWQRMKNALFGRSNNGALVRFSTESTNSVENDTRMMKEFIKVIAPLISQNLFK